MKAMEFLFDKGHKRIAHIMAPVSMPISQIRLEGYKKALAQHKIEYDPALVKEVDFSQESTFKAMEELMKMKSAPTALFNFKNYISLDVIQYLKKYAPSKLKKMDVVGFGNLPLIHHLDHKPAASIEENSYAMGMEAAQLLLDSMNTQNASQKESLHQIIVPCKLVIHEK